MLDIRNPTIQLAIAGLLLVGLGFSGILLSRANADRARRAQRLAYVVEPHIRHASAEVVAFTERTQSKDRSVLNLLYRLFGFHPDKASLYPTRWWIVIGVTFVAAKVAQSFAGDFLGTASLAVLPIAWVVFARHFFSYFERRRQQLLLSEFPDALAMIVRTIRVGIPVMEAIRGVSREAPPATAAEFGVLVEQIAVGVSAEDAVNELAYRTGLSEYRFFATTMGLQAQTGGTLSETLEGLADVIRKRAAVKAKGHAMTSEARSSAMVLSVLPFLTGAMLWVLNPTYIGVLFTDETGKSMLSIAMVLLVIGLLAMRTIIARVLP